MDDLASKEDRLNKLVIYLFNNSMAYCQDVNFNSLTKELTIEDCFYLCPDICRARDHSRLKINLANKCAEVFAYDESYHNGSVYNQANQVAVWEAAVDFAIPALNHLALIKMKSDEANLKAKELALLEQASLDKLIGL